MPTASTDVDSEIMRKLRTEYGGQIAKIEQETVLSDLAAIDKEIDLLNRETALLHAEIKKLYNQISDKNLEKAKKEQTRALKKGLLSPFRKISDEMLCEIFKQTGTSCIESHEDHDMGTQSPGAIVLASTCRRWRNVALSTPSLWANITVQLHSLSSARHWVSHCFGPRIQLFLKNSGVCLLDITLEVEGSTPSFHASVLSDLGPLMGQAQRWKTLAYYGDYPSCEYESLLPSLSFPALTEIFYFTKSVLKPSWNFETFANSPNLQALVTNTRLPSPLPALFHVSNLQIGCESDMNFLTAIYSLSELKRILQDSFPYLKSLAVLIRPYDADRSVWDEELDINGLKLDNTWLNITSLACGTTTESLDMLFSSFNFPSLKKVVFERLSPVDDCDGGYGWPIQAFKGFIARSECRIIKLTLNRFSITDEELIETLLILPNIQELEIEDYAQSYTTKECPITPDFFSALTFAQSGSHSQSDLIPQLHNLVIRSNYKLHANAELLDSKIVSMIESRRFGSAERRKEAMEKGQTQIRSVMVNFSQQKVDHNRYKRLRELEKEGLRVVVFGDEEQVV